MSKSIGGQSSDIKMERIDDKNSISLNYDAFKDL
jgi:hypothetical protein